MQDDNQRQRVRALDEFVRATGTDAWYGALDTGYRIEVTTSQMPKFLEAVGGWDFECAEPSCTARVIASPAARDAITKTGGGLIQQKERVCATCAGWIYTAAALTDQEETGGQVYAVFDRVVFIISGESVPVSMKGFGGKQYRVHWKPSRHDRVPRNTTNLWYYGRVPEAFTYRIRDNVDRIDGMPSS
jgi:hypothetical protein